MLDLVQGVKWDLVQNPEKQKKAKPQSLAFIVAPSDIISNLFLEDLEKIWELKKWIPDPCNPHLHYLKHKDKEE